MNVAASTVYSCTPRLLLQPQNNRANAWVLLNKADWQPIGEATLNAAGQLQHLKIEPEMRRQGLATELWQAMPRHDQVQSLEANVQDNLSLAAQSWLTGLGWTRRNGIPRPAALDFERAQQQHARRWADQLGVPANYSQSRALPLVAEPPQLECLGKDMYDRPIFLSPNASRAWRNLQQASARDNIHLLPVSGFRSAGYQGRLVAAKLAAGTGLDEILKVSAAPGFSEHHSGRALDISSPNSQPLEQTFADTEAFAWLTQNAGRWGFVMSYPENNCHQLAFEPWHWCFQES